MRAPADRQAPTRAPAKCRANWIAASLALLALGGCATAATDPTITTGSVASGAGEAAPAKREEKVVKIALILPFGAPGQTSAIAKGMKQAGEMALFDRDEAQFQIMAIDDRGTPEGARAAAEQAVRDGAELVLGPLFSQNVTAAAAVTRAANLPLIAFSNDRQVAGPGVYLMSYLPEDEVARVITYAASQGRRRIAALIPDDGFGRAADTALRQSADRVGARVVIVERYPVQANGMVEPARRLAEQIRQAESGGEPVDALFLPGGQETLANIGPLLSYAGIDARRIKILGTGGMDNPTIGKDPLFRGAWFAGVEPRGWQDFSSRFSKTFGTVPPRIAALAYDAVTAAASLAREPSAKRYSAANLTRPAGFNGVDGPVRLVASGLPVRSLAILEVQDIGSTVVEPGSLAAELPTQVSQTGGRLN